jgi:hypothetical protein
MKGSKTLVHSLDPRNGAAADKTMITDRRPAHDKLRREYDSSHRLEKIRAHVAAVQALRFPSFNSWISPGTFS